MKPAISVAGLTRRYRGQFVLDNVSFGSGRWVAP
jgi:hypothetical protein